ncbi:MAG: hypothetical protein EBU34_05225, partial [Alphaproteobacteria bacterium]|nr:hypothetical protein [Alphaproteobacteria bacterium]
MQASKHIPTLLDHLIWVILVGVFIFFVFQSPVFLTSTNITNIFTAAAVLGILVVGQTFVLISGNFDLSSESTLGVCALFGMYLIVPATPPYWGGGVLINPYLSIAVIIITGSLFGYINGLLITVGKMNNFIVTLAMLLILRGLMMCAMTALNFWALQYLQLAETGAMQFSVPILIAVFSAFCLGEKLDLRRWIAILAGFLGVLIIIRPGSHAFHPAILLTLLNAILYASFNLLTRHMAKTESAEATQWLAAVVAAAVLTPF